MSPIEFVYELEDTGPPIDRTTYRDPFAVQGQLRNGTVARLRSRLKQQKQFWIDVELRRQGSALAGTAAAQGARPTGATTSVTADAKHSSTHGQSEVATPISPKVAGVPGYRVTLNDRHSEAEQFVTLGHELGHIFCGHVGECRSLIAGEGGWPNRSRLSQDIKEVEAESVAHIVAQRAGLETESATYLKQQVTNDTISKIDVDLVVRAAARVERLADIHHGTMLFDKRR